MRTDIKNKRPGRPMLCPDQVLRRILAMRNDDGRSFQSICDELNGEGIPTPAGKKKWGRNHIHRLLGTQRALDLQTEQIADPIRPTFRVDFS